jgi:hypothetical protein
VVATEAVASAPVRSVKCTRQRVLAVVGRHKCPSSLARTVQSTVAIVTSHQSVLREIPALAGNYPFYYCCPARCGLATVAS